MESYKGVLVCGEIENQKLSACTTELLGGGRSLANKLGDDLVCVLLGDELKSIPESAIAYNADTVYAAKDPILKNYQPDVYVSVIERIVRKVKPKLILIGQTDIGRDLAPRLAFRMKVGLCMDCIELKLDHDENLIRMTRPVLGGNAIAVLVSKRLPQIATIRQKTMSVNDPDHSRKGRIEYIEPNIEPSTIRAKVIKTIKEEIPGVKLEDAQVVVAGGRGIGSKEGFEALTRLANKLKGAVGATRVPCESGWIPSTSQIGLTGKVVTPKLYIAIAVSGACQHLAGCSGAKTLIAINNDPDANIFKAAHFGAVGDWKQVVPAFEKKITELLIES